VLVLESEPEASACGTEPVVSNLIMWDLSSTSWNAFTRSDSVAEPASSGTQALDRAVQLVSSVVQADEPLSFAELQESTGLAKSTTSRMLAALERGGLLERDDSGGYVAGSLFWLYGARHDPWEELVRLAGPVLQQVGSDTQESVHLSVIRGGQVVQVAQVDSRYLLGTRDWTEVDVPAHASALGKVFYAWDALTPAGRLDKLTPSTITSKAGLERDGEETRRRGYAVTIDELEEGLTGVAVPVRGARGNVVAALGISGPTSRLSDRLAELGRNLTRQAAQLESLLHGEPPTIKKGVA
jgi:DNA-binding IclR family transcriptional regulator